ncbi:uncharacterized protein LOC123439820 [Hordeum vulgare subsp. vulgare]|uniref:uncharacterized protein LOC123439820 n=1 Tax=Hordeum vulgare subsp. vulgare TaxID=112509 RepID=UPI001D1A39FB|nr:uncharacterized protein LOC123439820 [Hordeum vulgare subsp. vulgare]
MCILMFKRQHPSSSPSSEPGFVAPPTSVGSGASTSCTRWSSSSAGSLSSSKPQDRHQGAPTTPPVPFPLSGSATAITVVQPLRSTPRFPEHTTELRDDRAQEMADLANDYYPDISYYFMEAAGNEE